MLYTNTFDRTKGRTLEQIDGLFGDQLVPHALEDPVGAAAIRDQMEEKSTFAHAEEAG